MQQHYTILLAICCMRMGRSKYRRGQSLIYSLEGGIYSQKEASQIVKARVLVQYIVSQTSLVHVYSVTTAKVVSSEL